MKPQSPVRWISADLINRKTINSEQKFKHLCKGAKYLHQRNIFAGFFFSRLKKSVCKNYLLPKSTARKRPLHTTGHILQKTNLTIDDIINVQDNTRSFPQRLRNLLLDEFRPDFIYCYSHFHPRAFGDEEKAC